MVLRCALVRIRFSPRELRSLRPQGVYKLFLTFAKATKLRISNSPIAICRETPWPYLAILGHYAIEPLRFRLLHNFRFADLVRLLTWRDVSACWTCWTLKQKIMHMSSTTVLQLLPFPQIMQIEESQLRRISATQRTEQAGLLQTSWHLPLEGFGDALAKPG